ncbi:hypothetical protein JXA80_00330, partial [bacterium]|nr:hypothetical protein [candidate division CSSED10-310 bacterium]
MTSPSIDTPVCHLILKPGEMLLKSKPVRRAFAHRLISNLWDAIHHSGCDPTGTQIRREQGIITVRSRDLAVVPTVSRVFGTISIARVQRLETTELDIIVQAGLAHFRSAVTGRRFAVRCK